jgi:hypothetical protein
MGDRYVCRRASRQADATKSRKKRKLNANQSSTAAFRLIHARLARCAIEVRWRGVQSLGDICGLQPVLVHGYRYGDFLRSVGQMFAVV